MEEGVALIAQVALSFMVECEKELLLFSDSLLGMMLSLCVINNKEDRAKGNRFLLTFYGWGEL